MTGFAMEEDIDSEEEIIMEALNENYKRQYVIDMNYNRPLKNFPLTLNMIEEVDETCVKSPETDGTEDENGNVVYMEVRRASHVVWGSHEQIIPISNREIGKARPKSASSAAEGSKKVQEKTQKRPKSSCAGYPSRIPVKKKEPRVSRSDSESSINASTTEEIERSYSTTWEKKRKDNTSRDMKSPDLCMDLVNWMDYSAYPDRPTSACCMRSLKKNKRRWEGKRSNSQPDIGATQPRPRLNSVWYDVTRFRRSLHLLGLSSSDFGLPDSPKHETLPRPRSTHCASPTFSTRVLHRSYSLDCLKQVVKDSAKNPYSGLPQRQILAQAAYEEWYFAKLKDKNGKLKEENEKAQKMKEMMEEQNRMRGEKAAEKFQAWMEAKRRQEKQRKPSVLKAKLENRLIKSREEIDKAYLEWKKHKTQNFSKKKMQKIKEEEKTEREKAQKEEKRIHAEKAFIEWKNKLEEKQKILKEKEKKSKERIKEQLTARSKSNIEFQVWKQRKDDELKMERKKGKDAAKQVDDERSMILSERLYEADQAFEEWLEKVETRKAKQKGKQQKTIIPWAPS